MRGGQELVDPVTAFREIDRVLEAAARYKRPVYIEIPRDMVKVVPGTPYEYRRAEPTSDPDALAEAVAEATRFLNYCQKPVLLAGVEIHRFGLQDDVMNLAEGSQIPIASTILGKSAVRETHPLFVGMYEGAMGREEVTRYVEESDCLLMLGAFLTDIDMGIYTANLDVAKCIFATSEELRIRHHFYHNVVLADFIRALAAQHPRPPHRPVPARLPGNDAKYTLRPQAPMTITRLIARLNESLDANTIVISDVGDALFAATELTTHARTEFIGPAYYTSMGFAIPASLGTGVARPDMRTVVLVGDGAFQMTSNELSSIVRHSFDHIVIVLDNKGYGTERYLHPGEFNEIHPWHYSKITELLGGGTGYEVRSEGEFDEALRKAWADNSGMSLIHVHLAVDDCSPALKRLAERLSKKV